MEKCKECDGSGINSYPNHDTAYPTCNDCNGSGISSSPSKPLYEDEYKPISCDHKIKAGRFKGFNNWNLLSHSSASGPGLNYEVNISVCRYCGEIKVSGKKLINGKWNIFNEEFSIYLPESVEAIVRNCNYMNAETEGYIPFAQIATAKLMSLEECKDNIAVKYGYENWNKMKQLKIAAQYFGFIADKWEEIAELYAQRSTRK